MTVERWGLHELTLSGPADGNPFADVELRVAYQYRNRVVVVDGFYDGDGVYRARFSPDREGEWSYVTSSSATELDGHRGSFVCTPPGPDNHGPVGVRGSHHFAYADGTHYDCIGTTCYHWTYESKDLQELTLASLRSAPFDKVRMCLLPTDGMRPERTPFGRGERIDAGAGRRRSLRSRRSSGTSRAGSRICSRWGSRPT